MSTGLTRRQMLTGAALAAACGLSERYGRMSALASVTLGPRRRRTGGDALVVLFLRGGADGLNVIVPYGDEDYYRLRPTLAIPRPNDATERIEARAIDLDGFFGLHPALAPLLPVYREGRFVPVHAVGSGDRTRSHFEAMATMERGLAQDTGPASGWLARHLAVTAEDSPSPLRAVAVTDTMPDSLRGAPGATVLSSLSDYRLRMPDVAPTGSGGAVYHPVGPRSDAVADALRGLYAAHGDRPLRSSGRETLAALDAVRKLDPRAYHPAPGVTYPANEVGRALLQVACMVKGDVGLEIACLDMTGWDTHVTQGRDTGWQPARLADLASALAAFDRDLGALTAHVTTLVMTEFGRRAYENSGLGTDHGRAGVMLLLGGGLRGGKVYAQWPGLAPERLEGPGDLHVTTDYRDVLAEILVHRAKNHRVAEVFPEFRPRFIGVTAA